MHTEEGWSQEAVPLQTFSQRYEGWTRTDATLWDCG